MKNQDVTSGGFKQRWISSFFMRRKQVKQKKKVDENKREMTWEKTKNRVFLP